MTVTIPFESDKGLRFNRTNIVTGRYRNYLVTMDISGGNDVLILRVGGVQWIIKTQDLAAEWIKAAHPHPPRSFRCEGGPGHDDPDNSGLCIRCGGVSDGSEIDE